MQSHDGYYITSNNCPHSLNDICSISFTNNKITLPPKKKSSKTSFLLRRFPSLFSCCKKNNTTRLQRFFEGENYASFKIPYESVLLDSLPLCNTNRNEFLSENSTDFLTNELLNHSLNYQINLRERTENFQVINLPSSPKGDINLQMLENDFSNTLKADQSFDESFGKNVSKKLSNSVNSYSNDGNDKNEANIHRQFSEWDLNLLLDKKINYIKEIKSMLNENQNLTNDKKFRKLIKQAIFSPIVIKNGDKSSIKIPKWNNKSLRKKSKSHSKTNLQSIVENNQNNWLPTKHNEGVSICESNNPSISASFSKLYKQFTKPFELKIKAPPFRSIGNWNGISFSESRECNSKHHGIIDTLSSNSAEENSKMNNTEDQVGRNGDISMIYDSLSSDKNPNETDLRAENLDEKETQPHLIGKKTDSKIVNSIAAKDKVKDIKTFSDKTKDIKQKMLDISEPDNQETAFGIEYPCGSDSDSKMQQSDSIECLTVIDTGDQSQHEFTEINELLNKYANNSDVMKDVDYFDLSSSCSSIHDFLNSFSEVSESLAGDQVLTNERQLYDITEVEEPFSHKSDHFSITSSGVNRISNTLKYNYHLINREKFSNQNRDHRENFRLLQNIAAKTTYRSDR